MKRFFNLLGSASGQTNRDTAFATPLKFEKNFTLLHWSPSTSIKLALSILFFGLCVRAVALPLPTLESLAKYQEPIVFAPLFQAFDFDGIVKLSNCSASLIRFENSLPDDLGLILTNGHCLDLAAGFLPPGQIIKNEPVRRKVIFLKSNGAFAGSAPATRVVYGTMTKTDIAIYELAESYKKIEADFGVHALTLSSQAPTEKTSIEVISGYWTRGYACQIDKEIFNLLEDGYLWERSLRYSQPGCDTKPGTSGSPVIEAGTRKVIAINNTGNEDGKMCEMNNPCEIDPQGNRRIENRGAYGQQTFWIYSCLNSQRQIDLTVAGCQLPQ